MVRINGEDLDVAGKTIAEYLAGTSYDLKRIAVERCGEIVPKSAYASTTLADAFGVTVDELLRGPKAPLAAEHLPAAPAIQLEENTGPFPTESASPTVTSEHTPQTADTC